MIVHNNLRVAINAQIVPGLGVGGVESVLIGLIKALGQLEGPEEYTIIASSESPDWLKPYIGPNQKIVRCSEKHQPSLLRILRPLPLARKSRNFLRQMLGISSSTWPEVPISTGFYESLGCDVIHFPYQEFTLCALPTVYTPHDLQHLHYPQFFTASGIAWSETVYPAGCHFANTISVASRWVKQDIIKHYHVNPEKVQVIPWAPPTSVYVEPSPNDLASVESKYQLSIPFTLYPAMTWEHKNHIRLLEALALLRDRDGLKINLICTGYKNSFYPRIQERLHAFNLQGQVKFLGLVPPEDLRALYRLAQFVIIPTLFEAASGPLFEAWQEHTPVACSKVTSLPEQAGEAALLFDSLSVDAIADAISKMATKPELREVLKQKGMRRLGDFSWERTAKAYRAVYRRVAGKTLTEEDRWILSWDWMREPGKKKEM